jgi:predicted nucleotidyltransferase
MSPSQKIGLSEQDRRALREVAERFGGPKLYLFGSSLDADKEPGDIDLGVEGLAPDRFYRFYSELDNAVSRPVDLVDLRDRNKFTDLIRRLGVRVV